MAKWKLLLTSGFCVCLAAVTSAIGDDWPHFLGPKLDNVSAEKGLLKAWPESGPKQEWTIKTLGAGYSGPAVVGESIFISGTRGSDEMLFALDSTGKEKFAVKIGAMFQWKGNDWNIGPSATPTVAGSLVIAMGGFGDLIAVDAKTGAEKWRVHLPNDFGGEVHPIGGGLEEPTPLGWGYTGSPIVDGDLVVVACGGKQGLLLGLDLATGKKRWQSKDVPERTTYACPIMANIGGVKQYIARTYTGAVGFDDTGKVLWKFQRQPAYGDCVITAPVVYNDRVYLTCGFGEGCELIEIKKEGEVFRVDLKYQNKNMGNRDGGVVLIDGKIYGHSENKGWMCQDADSGEIAWTEKRKLGRGSITSADGMLYCLDDTDGVVALINASPDGWKEHGRFTLPNRSANRQPQGGVWTHPVVSGGKLYLRDQEFLYCYSVAK